MWHWRKHSLSFLLYNLYLHDCLPKNCCEWNKWAARKRDNMFDGCGGGSSPAAKPLQHTLLINWHCGQVLTAGGNMGVLCKYKKIVWTGCMFHTLFYPLVYFLYLVDMLAKTTEKNTFKFKPFLPFNSLVCFFIDKVSVRSVFFVHERKVHIT